MQPLTIVGGGLALLAVTATVFAGQDDQDRAVPTPGGPPARPPARLGPPARPQLYEPDLRAPFGPKFKTRRPPGLPTVVATARGPAGLVRVDGVTAAHAEGTARRLYQARHKSVPSRVDHHPVRLASARGAALPAISRLAGKAGLGEPFVKTMLDLARKEGEGGTFAVPARNFNAPCVNRLDDKARRCTTVDAPRRGTLITAWGVYQWNRDAGREIATLDNLGLRAPRLPADWMPWDWSDVEEVRVPIDYYAQLWRLVRRRGGSIRDAARGVRLWHTGPSRFRRYIAAGAGPRAWARVDSTVAQRIDHHLANASVA